MATLTEIKSEISNIKERNKRVELDKAWETSLARKVILFVLTYIVVVIFFFVAGLPNPFVNSLVPAVAFVLSTMSIPFFKKWWLSNKQGR